MTLEMREKMRRTKIYRRWDGVLEPAVPSLSAKPELNIIRDYQYSAKPELYLIHE